VARFCAMTKQLLKKGGVLPSAAGKGTFLHGIRTRQSAIARKKKRNSCHCRSESHMVPRWKIITPPEIVPIHTAQRRGSLSGNKSRQTILNCLYGRFRWTNASAFLRLVPGRSFGNHPAVGRAKSVQTGSGGGSHPGKQEGPGRANRPSRGLVRRLRFFSHTCGRVSANGPWSVAAKID